MASEYVIDHISQGGVRYEFADGDARAENVMLATKLNTYNVALNEKISAEIERAKAAEAALENTKMTQIPNMGLSTNDFNDNYKALLDDPVVFTGATVSGDGVKGCVPKPVKGDQEKFLCGDGTWAVPHDTTYENATQTVAGLMSITDKYKLDNMVVIDDDMVSCNTTFGNGTINQVFGNGRAKNITFNSDGSITEVITQTGADTITLTTVFNADGSITRTRS